MSGDNSETIAFPYQHHVVVDKLPRSEMGWKKRNISRVRLIAWHRCNVAEDPKDIAQWFIDNKKWVGHPYHFQINLDSHGEAIVYQTALLVERTAGLFGWNNRGIHIMIHGDFRYQQPERKLFHAAACLAADLRGFNIGDRCGGHSEASYWLPKKYWTKKSCPGKSFYTEACRRIVSRLLIGNETGLTVLPVGESWWQTR